MLCKVHFGSPNDLKTFAKTAGLSSMDLHADDSVILLYVYDFLFVDILRT